jgi:hypothetical protein
MIAVSAPIRAVVAIPTAVAVALAGQTPVNFPAASPARPMVPMAKPSNDCRGAHGAATPYSNAPLAHVSAQNQAGLVLPLDPALTQQETLYVNADGFASGADVTHRLGNSAPLSHARANSAGVVTIAYPLLAVPNGEYTLNYSGAPAGVRLGGNLVVAIAVRGSFPFIVGCEGATPRVVAVNLKLKASPNPITYGKTCKLTVSVARVANVSSSGLRMVLWKSVAGGKWTKAVARSTNGAGLATFTVRPAYNTRFQVRFSGGTYDGVYRPAARSASVTVHVRAKIAVAVRKQWTLGSQAPVKITVLPKLKGRTVYLQLDGKTIARVRTSRSGRVTILLTLNRTGRHRLKVVVPASKRNVRSTKTVTIAVR